MLLSSPSSCFTTIRRRFLGPSAGADSRGLLRLAAAGATGSSRRGICRSVPLWTGGRCKEKQRMLRAAGRVVGLRRGGGGPNHGWLDISIILLLAAVCCPATAAGAGVFCGRLTGKFVCCCSSCCHCMAAGDMPTVRSSSSSSSSSFSLVPLSNAAIRDEKSAMSEPSLSLSSSSLCSVSPNPRGTSSSTDETSSSE